MALNTLIRVDMPLKSIDQFVFQLDPIELYLVKIKPSPFLLILTMYPKKRASEYCQDEWNPMISRQKENFSLF